MNGWRILRAREDNSLALFMLCVEECISERECKKFEEGLKLNWLRIKCSVRMKYILAWNE